MSCLLLGVDLTPKAIVNPVQQTRRHFKTKRFGLMISSYLAQTRLAADPFAKSSLMF